MTDLPDKLAALATEAHFHRGNTPGTSVTANCQMCRMQAGLREAEAALREKQERLDDAYAALTVITSEKDAEIERLRIDMSGDRATTHWETCHLSPKHHACAVARGDRLQAELDAARHDTERLDWLSNADQMDFAMPVADPVTKRWYIYHNDDANDVCNKDTLREAIDAAMKETE